MPRVRFEWQQCTTAFGSSTVFMLVLNRPYGSWSSVRVTAALVTSHWRTWNKKDLSIPEAFLLSDRHPDSGSGLANLHLEDVHYWVIIYVDIYLHLQRLEYLRPDDYINHPEFEGLQWKYGNTENSDGHQDSDWMMESPFPPSALITTHKRSVLPLFLYLMSNMFPLLCT